MPGPDQQPILALGLMSGTSMDGVDAALLVTDGIEVERFGAALSTRYTPEDRAVLRAAVGGAAGDEAEAAAARAVTDVHIQAVQALLKLAGCASQDVGVIGFHGHTIHHDPANGVTRQIGDAARLAAITGIDVVSDFRAADVAAGGQGAPLAPVFHAALAKGLVGRSGPVAVLNLGGVGNVTWIGGDQTLLAFDTGPGCALIDDWVRARTGNAFDVDGALASAGIVDEAVLAALLADPYFSLVPPKSLDRDHFDTGSVEGLSPADGAAVLSAFTATAVARGATWFEAPPCRWLVTGGGRHNAALMRGLADQLSAPVEAVEAVGWDGDALEAQAFAYLAARSLAGLPLSFPQTTGIAAPLTGGRLTTAT